MAAISSQDLKMFSKQTEAELCCENAGFDKESVIPNKISRQTKKEGKVSDEVRLLINDRERSRMHQLNKAMDDLKEVLPYSRSVNKLSKMSTLLLARNHIVSLQKTHQELVFLQKQLVAKQTRQETHPMFRKSTHPGFPVYVDTSITEPCGRYPANIKPKMQDTAPLRDIENVLANGQINTRKHRVPHKFSIEALLSN